MRPLSSPCGAANSSMGANREADPGIQDNVEDLRLRFDRSIAHDSLPGIVDRLAASTLSYGIFGPMSDLAAVCQVGGHDSTGKDLEAGNSVLESYRRTGLAAALLNVAAREARSRGFINVVVFCVIGNIPMISLARRLGMTVEVSRGGAVGRLRLRTAAVFESRDKVA